VLKNEITTNLTQKLLHVPQMHVVSTYRQYLTFVHTKRYPKIRGI